MVFFFSVRGEGKYEIIYKKKKIYFCPLVSFFEHFLSLVCRKKSFGSVSGEGEGVEKKKGNFKKKMLSAFF